ncbi:type II toxin-antitoxin system VapC family toxin [Haloactinopolyspora alba]|uniref:type II toxin-antitoxin system VapC family toxin n=1 Tax=Haloactinopolyspora alba TaxID=648780 RepID=UPI000D0CF86E|nr:type II toxin-antitoxin system VapC family toxin [Haloactinopolyspora alba]
MVSAVRGLRIGGHLSDSRAHDVLTDFDDLPVERWWASDAFRRRTLHLGHNLSAYDASYVALAEALDCPLVTRDARVGRASGHHARVEVL